MLRVVLLVVPLLLMSRGIVVWRALSASPLLSAPFTCVVAVAVGVAFVVAFVVCISLSYCHCIV